MSNAIGRRRFVQMAGAAVFGAMSLKMIGCAPSGTATDAEGAGDAERSSEVLIVGAGGSGLAAAVSLAEAGRSVVVIEALTMVGGATSCAEFQTVTTKDGVEGKNDKDAMFEFWWANSEQKANEGLVRQVADNCAETLAWLEGLGLDLYDMAQEGEQLSSPMFFRTPDPEGHLVAGNGGIVTNLLQAKLDELGGVIYTNTEARTLLVDDSGAVVGVEALKDGKPVTFRASKVVLASGGFTGGAGEEGEVLEKYFPVLLGSNILNHDFAGSTGHGIMMAEEIGALTRFDGQGCRGNLVIQGDGKFGHGIVGMAEGSIVMVNGDGERFANEANPMVRQVFNAALENKGTDGLYAFVPQAALFPEIADDVKNGYAFQGDSVADVARQAGVDASVQETVEAYNANAANGADDPLGKPAEKLVPIEGDPINLYKVWVRIGGSIGGIMTDEKTQVLGVDGGIIPNLYAVGDCANTNFHYKTYQGSGTGTCWAMNSGRIAASSILADL